MKKGWEIKPLKDLCVVDWGNTKLTKSSYTDDGEFLAVSAAGCDGRIGHKEHSKYTPVLSAIGALCGKMFFPEENFTAIKNTITLTPREGVCDGKFLYYLLTHVNLPQRGSAQPFISKGDIQNFHVDYPKIPEQQRIVAILDEAFEGIAKAKANTEQNLKNARELFESHLQAVFSQRGEGGGATLLGDVCTITSKLVEPRHEEHLDLIHIGAGNIESKTGKLIDLKTSRDEGLISGKFLFDTSTVLYSKIRPYLMKVVRPNFNGLCSADIYPLKPKNNKITRDFLYYLLLSEKFTTYAIQGSARAGMPKVNREHLFNYQFSVPDIMYQKDAVETLDTLSTETQRLESIYRQKIAALDELKKSLLHKAFSGEL